MSAPVVVRVLDGPVRTPMHREIRVVALSDGTERMEEWDYRLRAWVPCDYDAWGFAHSFGMTEADLRKLGIPVDPVFEGAAPGGAEMVGA